MTLATGSASAENVHRTRGLFPIGEQNGVEVEFFQSNLEGEIVDKIQECLGTVDGIMINPAAFSKFGCLPQNIFYAPRTYSASKENEPAQQKSSKKRLPISQLVGSVKKSSIPEQNVSLNSPKPEEALNIPAAVESVKKQDGSGSGLVTFTEE